MRSFRSPLALVVSAGVLVIGAALLGLIMLRTYGLVADRAPGRLETAVARRLVVLSIPSSATRMTNPNDGQPDAWRAGADHFAEHCAMCHGDAGRGRSEIGPKMYPPVPDLADPAIQRMSDGALFAVIQNGVRWTGMPAFRSTHTPEEIWKLVSFVRRVPQLSAEDLKPKPAHETQNATAAPGTTIAMDGTTFVPAQLTVKVGDTVTWVNKDPFPHTVVSTVGGFRSRPVDPDHQFRWRANKAGRFPFVCTLHPGMKGTLVVQP